MKKLLEEFKAFVMRGNVLDMAVGVIIAGAFGNVDFSSLEIKLGEPVEGAEQAAIRYGLFIQEIVNFLIIALCIFIFIKVVASLQKKKEEAPAPNPEPTKEEVLLTEIRDALNKMADK